MSKPLDMPILKRMLDPLGDCLNVEAARRLISYKADAAVQKRVSELAEKCNDGMLTPDERAEYDSIVTADSIISIMKAQARFYLSKRAR